MKVAIVAGFYLSRNVEWLVPSCLFEFYIWGPWVLRRLHGPPHGPRVGSSWEGPWGGKWGGPQVEVLDPKVILRPWARGAVRSRGTKGPHQQSGNGQRRSSPAPQTASKSEAGVLLHEEQSENISRHNQTLSWRSWKIESISSSSGQQSWAPSSWPKRTEEREESMAKQVTCWVPLQTPFSPVRVCFRDKIEPTCSDHGTWNEIYHAHKRRKSKETLKSR